jgi:hypothetical protein
VRIFKNNSKSNGYEILSDYQRSLLKFPTRGRPDGWIIDEILVWEKYRFEAMFMPLIMAVKASESGFREKGEKTPVTSSSPSQIPRKKTCEQKANHRPHPETAWIVCLSADVYYIKATVPAPMPINEAMEKDWVPFQKNRY